jgi:2-iminobutanoate/2-iminopropanoate deaminase
MIPPSDDPGNNTLPFSSAIRTDNGLLSVSGSLGLDESVIPPVLVDGGMGSQTRQSIENILTILNNEGLSLEDIVKCNIFVSDLTNENDMTEFNAVYGEYFSKWKPARALYGGVQIALGGLIEIEVIAVDSSSSAASTSATTATLRSTSSTAVLVAATVMGTFVSFNLF